MKRVKPESLKALNQKLDIVRVLEEIGVADIADTHPEVLSSCPFHGGTDVEAVLTVDKKSRTAICDESSCVVASGEPLLDVYVRAKGGTQLEGAEYWAGVVGIALDYDEPAPAPVAAASDVDDLGVDLEPDITPEEAGAALLGEVGGIDLDAHAGSAGGELHADDIDSIDGAQTSDPFADELSEPAPWAVPGADDADLNETATDIPRIPPGSSSPMRHGDDGGMAMAPIAAATITPLTTVNFTVPSESPDPIAGVRPDRVADEEAILRYLLSRDPGALHEVVALGITDHDFRGGGSGPRGLSTNGAIFSSVRKLHERHREVDRESLLSFVPDEHRQKALEAVAHIQRGTSTEPKRFRQALKRIAEVILRENLESALRASITDIVARPDSDAHTLLAHAQERLAAVGRGASAPLVTQEMAMPEISHAILDPETVPVTTFSSGLNKLMNGGLQFGSFTVLAGPSGSGKTSLLLQLADGVAASNNERVQKGLSPVPVVYVSTTSSRRQLATRSLARYARLNAGALISKRWITGWEGDYMESESDIDESVEPVGKYYERRLKEAEAAYRAAEPYLAIVEGSPWISVDGIRSYVLQALRRFGARSAILIVDSMHYVGIGEADRDPAAFRDEVRLEAVGARLRHMATSMGLPVIATIDVAESEIDTHGRTSRPAPLESVADLVLGLSVDEDILDAGHVKHPPSALSKRQNALKEVLERLREQSPLEYSHSEYAILEPMKHRMGPPDPVVFTFHKAWSRFEDLDL